jgi:hypothetical protein
MREMTKRIAVGAALLLLPGLVRADAPIGQYKPYLSTQSTIQDEKTFLQWERATSPTPQRLSQARCPAGARFPSVRELATLVDNEPAIAYDEKGAPQFVYIDANAFPSTPRAAFWTSTATPEGKVFVVDFGNGEIRLVDPTQVGVTAHLRCVKNG